HVKMVPPARPKLKMVKPNTNATVLKDTVDRNVIKDRVM
ncbi:hypothetical protein GCK32_019421, partial [Trichostrongylus colubriformis]